MFSLFFSAERLSSEKVVSSKDSIVMLVIRLLDGVGFLVEFLLVGGL